MDRMTPEERAALFFDDTETWRDRRGYTLSDRLWHNRQELRRRIDTTLREAIRTGRTVEVTATVLEQYLDPAYQTAGKAHYPATRLARNETKRAHGLATKAVTQTDPAGGYVRYRLSRSRHIDPHQCDAYASHDEGFGYGVWPATDCPIPNVDTHVGCNCFVERIPLAARGMDAFVDQLRVEYELEDPDDLWPSDLAEFRRLTQPMRDGVTFMFASWFQQTGLVTQEQVVEELPTVKRWIAWVRAEKGRRRGR